MHDYGFNDCTALELGCENKGLSMTGFLLGFRACTVGSGRQHPSWFFNHRIQRSRKKNCRSLAISKFFLWFTFDMSLCSTLISIINSRSLSHSPIDARNIPQIRNIISSLFRKRKTQTPSNHKKPYNFLIFSQKKKKKKKTEALKNVAYA
jgi:hypothetical protein